ncbi:topology modulation protein [Peribacillus frigoritolerans]
MTGQCGTHTSVSMNAILLQEGSPFLIEEEWKRDVKLTGYFKKYSEEAGISMERIMVIGVSAGVGKSTFARRLGDNLNIEVYHLDTFYWRSGWVEAPLEDFISAQKEVVSHDKWIMDGNYSHSFNLRSELADTIIYLELPLRVCLYRVIKRLLSNLGKARPDMAKGCNEKLDWQFIKFIISTYLPRKKEMKARFADLQKSDPEKVIVILKSKPDIEGYLLSVLG